MVKGLLIFIHERKKGSQQKQESALMVASTEYEESPQWGHAWISYIECVGHCLAGIRFHNRPRSNQTASSFFSLINSQTTMDPFVCLTLFYTFQLLP